MDDETAEADTRDARADLTEALERKTALCTTLAVRLAKAERAIFDTHRHAVVCGSDCDKPYCPICQGGLFVCDDCGAAEAEASERVCTGPRDKRTNLLNSVSETAKKLSSQTEELCRIIEEGALL